jgi:hypothetical protein
VGLKVGVTSPLWYHVEGGTWWLKAWGYVASINEDDAEEYDIGDSGSEG